ncbi:Free methionine-(R)-sulfoxide reductase, contains GAF domain protein [Alkalibacterium sp. AK22]|uniref:GAF domain-containing protein n=1 Tax=Alkalibacterium sp. AK22 TaxID=1229520 RepID=UPI0004499705|nr:GAF domain-containing protein [Alkalibacterium sp. AK22]EXJ22833.1 Free methionine-(R)-sulfoxide reductase, contains GAF domain protein [Alkalibacterium sp. AK22]
MKNDLTYLLSKQLQAVTDGEPNLIANLSNASALLNDHLSDINWAGFYLWEEVDDELVLGPFQGKVACVRIKKGQGVCGSALEQEKTLVVPDVHQFPGHIACDSASQSEIVVPLIKAGRKIGVLDVDAPITDRFTQEDQNMLEEFCSVLLGVM